MAWDCDPIAHQFFSFSLVRFVSPMIEGVGVWIRSPAPFFVLIIKDGECLRVLQPYSKAVE